MSDRETGTAKRCIGPLQPSAAGSALAICVMLMLMLMPLASQAQTIAVFTKNLVNANYVALRLGVDKAAGAMGAKTYHRVPKHPDDPVEQIAMLAEVARDKPDAIIFNPTDVDRLAEPFRMIDALRIPVVNVVNRAYYADRSVFVGADDELVGYATAKYLFDAMGGHGRVAVLEGPSTAVTSVDRSRGFARALRERPDIVVVATADGKYLQPEGEAQMRAILSKERVIDGVLAANDSMALGALQALEAAGRALGVKVVGINGVPEAIDSIEAGRMLATENYSGFLLGCISGFAAVRELRGLPVPHTINLPVEMIDRANVAKFKVPLAQQQCPAWEALVR